jgi:hypothetical protein
MDSTLDTVPNRLAHSSTILHKEESLVTTTTFPKAIVSLRIRKKSPKRCDILIIKRGLYTERR